MDEQDNKTVTTADVKMAGEITPAVETKKLHEREWKPMARYVLFANTDEYCEIRRYSDNVEDPGGFVIEEWPIFDDFKFSLIVGVNDNAPKRDTILLPEPKVRARRFIRNVTVHCGICDQDYIHKVTATDCPMCKGIAPKVPKPTPEVDPEQKQFEVEIPADVDVDLPLPPLGAEEFDDGFCMGDPSPGTPNDGKPITMGELLHPCMYPGCTTRTYKIFPGDGITVYVCDLHLQKIRDDLILAQNPIPLDTSLVHDDEPADHTPTVPDIPDLSVSLNNEIPISSRDHSISPDTSYLDYDKARECLVAKPGDTLWRMGEIVDFCDEVTWYYALCGRGVLFLRAREKGGYLLITKVTVADIPDPILRGFGI